ncbi:MAG: segregation/condensation protein A [Clostridia bacterium]|nr:segregation/condensation protein A [Clostridia bacterium]
MDELTYRLDRYEGPLDLLLSLIAKNKVEITDIPIAMICDQYMEYLAEAREMDLEIASEFIVMASELMLIKSRMLLPREDDGKEDPRKELVDALLLYRQAKQAAEELRPLYAEFSGRITKDNDDVPPEKGFPLGLDTALLTKALNVLLARFKSSELEPEVLINPLIKPHVVSVEEKIEELLDILDLQESASLFFLLKDASSRPELLARFMGILELTKIQRILIVEDKSGIEPGEGEEFIPHPDVSGLRIRFMINPNFDPNANPTSESEFDNDDRTESEQPNM